MSERWIVTIETWPFHGVGQDFAGHREQQFIVEGHEFSKAVAAAELLQTGILTNPAVWQAPIKSVRQARHDEYLPRLDRPCPSIYIDRSPSLSSTEPR